MIGTALRTAALLLTLLPFTPAAQAETFGERVMAPGLLATLEAGETRTFLHARVLPEAKEDTPAPMGGYRRLERQEERAVSISTTPAGRIALLQGERQVADFAKSTPHPVLLMFLENVMRAVAQETGGNPHYIRNRMRMTLGAQELTGAEMTITPFAEDPNHHRFGEFAALQITVRWRPDAPAELTELSASLPGNPERYSETFRAADM